ncbi:helix-turn-helix transcriptional regulator [Kocuria marina]|uniref:helix-turn-helix transcriptional regulator n=1 Tax=Kocuria marina TaxID=223184 RepID=UPI003F2053D4
MSDQELPGAVIRRARKEAGLTQKDLADLSGVSERTVRSIETSTGNPSVAALTAVTRTLGLDVVIR